MQSHAPTQSDQKTLTSLGRRGSCLYAHEEQAACKPLSSWNGREHNIPHALTVDMSCPCLKAGICFSIICLQKRRIGQRDSLDDVTFTNGDASVTAPLEMLARTTERHTADRIPTGGIVSLRKHHRDVFDRLKGRQ